MNFLFIFSYLILTEALHISNNAILIPQGFKILELDKKEKNETRKTRILLIFRVL